MRILFSCLMLSLCFVSFQTEAKTWKVGDPLYVSFVCLKKSSIETLVEDIKGEPIEVISNRLVVFFQ